jgi:hypothetical protein
VPHYHERPHERFALSTPADRFVGRVSEVATRRQQAPDAHYSACPRRYVNGAPGVRLPPTAVYINPDMALNARHLLDTPGSLRTVRTPSALVRRKFLLGNFSPGVGSYDDTQGASDRLEGPCGPVKVVTLFTTNICTGSYAEHKRSRLQPHSYVRTTSVACVVAAPPLFAYPTK